MSSLPFLKKQRNPGGVIIEHRQTSGDLKESHSSDDEEAPLKACARDLISAIHSKNEVAAAQALRAAFELLDAEPHEEGPHEPLASDNEDTE